MHVSNSESAVVMDDKYFQRSIRTCLKNELMNSTDQWLVTVAGLIWLKHNFSIVESRMSFYLALCRGNGQNKSRCECMFGFRNKWDCGGNRFLEWNRRRAADPLTARPPAHIGSIVHGSAAQLGGIRSAASADQRRRCRGRTALLAVRRSRRRRVLQLRRRCRRRRRPVHTVTGRIPDRRPHVQRRHRWWVVCPITFGLSFAPSFIRKKKKTNKTKQILFTARNSGRGRGAHKYINKKEHIYTYLYIYWHIYIFIYIYVCVYKHLFFFPKELFEFHYFSSSIPSSSVFVHFHFSLFLSFHLSLSLSILLLFLYYHYFFQSFFLSFFFRFSLPLLHQPPCVRFLSFCFWLSIPRCFIQRWGNRHISLYTHTYIYYIYMRVYVYIYISTHMHLCVCECMY